MRQWHVDLNRTRRRFVFASIVLLLTLGHVPASWAQEQGQVFVANYGGDTVTVYPLTTSGDKAPQYTVLGTLGDGPHKVAINHRTSELVVTNNVAIPYSVSVYDRSSGALKRKVTGPSTGLYRPTAVAVDEVNGEIYIANDWGRSITVYDVTASGDTAPKRTITSQFMIAPAGLAVDVAHDEIIVADYGFHSIVTFDRLASGDTNPKRVIAGAGLFLPQGIALDLAHDEILVANSYFQTPDRGAILAFGRTASGFLAAPLRRLEGSATQLCNPMSVAIDYLRDQIVVANADFAAGQCAQSVTAYARTADGDIPPARVIAGALPNLNYPISATLFYGSSVSVSNKASSANVSAGSKVTYNITTTANGGTALGVVVTDKLPSGLLWAVGGTDASACSQSGSQLTCSFGNLSKGQSKAITVSAFSTSASCPGITNQAAAAFNDGTADLTSVPSAAGITIKCK